MSRREILSPGQWAAYFALFCILAGALAVTQYLYGN